MRTTGVLIASLLALLASCSTGHDQSASPPPLRSLAPSSASGVPVITTQEWLHGVALRVRDARGVGFDAHVYVNGLDVIDISGRAEPTSYQATVEDGPEAATDGPGISQYIDDRDGRLRVGTLDASGKPGHWEAVHGHLGELGLGAFGPHGTQLVTLLENLSTGSRHEVSDGSSVAVEAHLAAVFQILTGQRLRSSHGRSAIPAGSRVAVQVVPDGSAIRRLHIDGAEVSRALNKIGIDRAHQLAGALDSFDIDVDYPDA